MNNAVVTSHDAKQLLQAVEKYLRRSDIAKHVKKIWIFDDTHPVIDFTYRRVHFAFDVIGKDASSVSVNLVRRGWQNSGFSITTNKEKKESIATGENLDQAFRKIISRFNMIKQAVDLRRHEKDASSRAIASEASLTEVWQAKSGKPKVGILTLPLGKNYGGNLQAFALMQTLRMIGCEPILINRRYAAKTFEPQKHPIDPAPLVTNRIEIEGKFENTDFIEKHIIPITRPFRSSGELRRHIGGLDLDAVVSGSDQVWRAKYARGLLLDFFHGYLSSSERDIKRISYAASFGSEAWEFDERQTRKAMDLVQLFDAVSVREDSAVGLCIERLGREAMHVLDPTLLLHSEQYKAVLGERADPLRHDYLVSYVLNPSEAKGRFLKQVAEELSLEISPAGGNPHGGSDRSVEGWLASFSSSNFVVTDSFHGVAFSIIFNKPFIVFGNPERGMARFTSILRMFDLEDRLVFDPDQISIEHALRPIHWQHVNDRLDNHRLNSINFLKTALGIHSPVSAKEVADTNKPTPGYVRGPSGQHREMVNSLCTGCGVCVSEVDAAAMQWNNDGFLTAYTADKESADIAKRVCPFNPAPEAAVQDEDSLGTIFFPEAPNLHPRGGRFLNSYIGYSNRFRPGSSSGGVATYVFNELLERNHVDSLFVVIGDRDSGYRYRIFRKGEDIGRISKTRYFPVTLDELFSLVDGAEGRIGVSGVACFIKAIRLKQHYRPELRERITFLVGIICGGLKSRFYTDYLAQNSGISGEYHSAQYRVKNPNGEANDYFFSAVDEKAQLHKVRMRKLGDMWGSGLFKNKACDFCTDVMTELADISVGDAWIPEYNKDGMGNSVVVTRSDIADKIIAEGIASRELSMKVASIDLVIRSQSGGLNHKHNALKFRTWLSRDRADFDLPAYRHRVEKEVSAADMLVQILRERVRAKSLKFWRESEGEARIFGKRMHRSRELLRNVTAARKAEGDGDGIFSTLLQVFGNTEPQQAVHVDAAIRPLVRWLRLKVRQQKVNFDQLLPVLPKQQSERLAESLRYVALSSGDARVR